MGKKTVCDTLAKTYGYKVIPKYTTKKFYPDADVAQYTDGTIRFKEDANLICLDGQDKKKLEELVKEFDNQRKNTKRNITNHNDKYYFYERKRILDKSSGKKGFSYHVLYCIDISDLDNVNKNPENNYILVCTDIETIEAIRIYIHSKSADCTVSTVLVIGNSRPKELGELKRIHDLKSGKNEDTWTWGEVLRVITDALLKTSSFDYVIINPYIDNQNMDAIEDRIIFQWDRFCFSDGKRVLPKHKFKNGQVVFIRPFEPRKRNTDDKFKIKRNNGSTEEHNLPDFVSAWMHDFFSKKGFKFKVVSLKKEDNENIISIIKKDIEEADIVVCDLTYNRTNCYWELGYAEGLGKSVILVVNDKSKNGIAFDKKCFPWYAFSLIKKTKTIYDISIDSGFLLEIDSYKKKYDTMKEGKRKYKRRKNWEIKKS
jgi:hypothetical protein